MEDRCGPWPSLGELDAEDGRGRGAALKAFVFARFAGSPHNFLPILPEVGDAPSPAAPYSPISRRCCEHGPGMCRAGVRDTACPCGKVPAEQVAGYRVPIGERCSTCRQHRPRPTELAEPCRLHRMPPAHECSGERHYPCGSRFANEDRRRTDRSVTDRRRHEVAGCLQILAAHEDLGGTMPASRKVAGLRIPMRPPAVTVSTPSLMLSGTLP